MISVVDHPISCVGNNVYVTLSMLKSSSFANNCSVKIDMLSVCCWLTFVLFSDGEALLCSLISKTILHTYHFHSYIHAIKFSPDGKYVVWLLLVWINFVLILLFLSKKCVNETNYNINITKLNLFSLLYYLEQLIRKLFYGYTFEFYLYPILACDNLNLSELHGNLNVKKTHTKTKQKNKKKHGNKTNNTILIYSQWKIQWLCISMYRLPALRDSIFIYWRYVTIVNNHWMCCFVGSLLLQEKVKCLYFMLRVRLGSIIHLYCTELSMDRMMKPRVWTGPVIQGNIAQTTAGHEQSQNLYSSCSWPGYDKN